jgi:hypothetical protein
MFWTYNVVLLSWAARGFEMPGLPPGHVRVIGLIVSELMLHQKRIESSIHYSWFRARSAYVTQEIFYALIELNLSDLASCPSQWGTFYLKTTTVSRLHSENALKMCEEWRIYKKIMCLIFNYFPFPRSIVFVLCCVIQIPVTVGISKGKEWSVTVKIFVDKCTVFDLDKWSCEHK